MLSRRYRVNHPKIRSAIHRLGKTTNPVTSSLHNIVAALDASRTQRLSFRVHSINYAGVGLVPWRFPGIRTQRSSLGFTSPSGFAHPAAR